MRPSVLFFFCAAILFCTVSVLRFGKHETPVPVPVQQATQYWLYGPSNSSFLISRFNIVEDGIEYECHDGLKGVIHGYYRLEECR